MKQFLHNLGISKAGVVPDYGNQAPESSHCCFTDSTGGTWYLPILIPAATIGRRASKPDSLRQVISVLHRLEPDDYIRYLLGYYEAGLHQFGEEWVYGDITTVLLAASQLIRPSRYLEIGVRRGRSMAMVAVTCPHCELVGFDNWQADYAGIPNPGPDFVIRELGKLGHHGPVILITGNSHVTVPDYLRQHPEDYFDLITVDGDHDPDGAAKDLKDVLPRLKKGGVVVFDDIVHPKHPYLIDVWWQFIHKDKRFSTWEFTELGYGVALAVRKW